MSLELPWEKRLKIKDMIDNLLKRKRVKIQNLAEAIGVLVAACPAVAYGWLYYKELDMIKFNALLIHHKDMEQWATLSQNAIQDLHWWRSNILTSTNKIRSFDFDMEIFSDASTTGWGAIYLNHKANGLWNAEERTMHINFLEIKAAFLALKCFAKEKYNKQILLRIDNITALAYINKMGGTRHKHLNTLTRTLWEWCIDRKIRVFAEYVASKENIADEGSRLTNIDTEWELANYAFEQNKKNIWSSYHRPFCQ